MKKTVRFLIIFMLIFFVSVSIATASLTLKQFYGYIGKIGIFVDGKELKLSGQAYISEDGITMVPLRDIAEALSCEVEWDYNTLSININSQKFIPEQATNIWLNHQKQKIEEMAVIRNVGPFYQDKSKNFQIASRSFGSGVAVDLNKENKIAEVVLDLNRKYSTLEGYYGVEDHTMNSLGSYYLIILADDREVYASRLIKPSDYPRYFAPGEIDLTNIKRLTFRLEWNDAEIGDSDLLVAVLANVNFYLK